MLKISIQRLPFQWVLCRTSSGHCTARRLLDSVIAVKVGAVVACQIGFLGRKKQKNTKKKNVLCPGAHQVNTRGPNLACRPFPRTDGVALQDPSSVGKVWANTKERKPNMPSKLAQRPTQLLTCDTGSGSPAKQVEVTKTPG